MVSELRRRRWGGWWIGESLWMRMMGIGEAKAFVEDDSLSTVRAESLRREERKEIERKRWNIILCYGLWVTGFKESEVGSSREIRPYGLTVYNTKLCALQYCCGHKLAHEIERICVWCVVGKWRSNWPIK